MSLLGPLCLRPNQQCARRTCARPNLQVPENKRLLPLGRASHPPQCAPACRHFLSVQQQDDVYINQNIVKRFVLINTRTDMGILRRAGDGAKARLSILWLQRTRDDVARLQNAHLLQQREHERRYRYNTIFVAWVFFCVRCICFIFCRVC